MARCGAAAHRLPPGTGQAPHYGAADGLPANRPSASWRATSEPDGTVAVVLAGGASQVSLSIPPGAAARLRLDGGASSATIGNLTYTGVAGGTMLTMPGWASAPRRYDIDAPVGVSAISVTSR
jgi:hypothetical protein